MAFTFTNYASPELSKSPINDIISNLFGGYEQGVKASYLQPSLQEELKKAQLVNKYYGPNIESEMGLRGAQAGHLGALTSGQNITNRYLEPKLKAEIDALNANSQKARLLQDLRQYIMGGNQQASQQPPQMTPFQGQGVPNLISQQLAQQQPSAQPIGQPMQQQSGGSLPFGGDYGKAALASQLLGLGSPKIVEVNGKQMAITPFGVVDTGVQGLTEQQKALSKEDAKKISSLENIVLNSSSKLDTFNELNNILGSPEFEAIRQNPALGRHELNWFSKFGTKEQQDLVGKAQTFMGNIIKDSARDFAGQFRIGEQALLNDMKPNTSDSLDKMKGKAEALTFLTTMMSKRAELEADYMRNGGLSPLQAKIAADKVLDSNGIKKEIHTILHPAKKIDITPEQAIAELQRRQAMGNQ